MDNLTIKSEKEIQIMAEGGKKLAKVKNRLFELIQEGNNAAEIESCAEEMIKKEGGRPSFMMVPGYSWATCVNLNQGLVHGIPKKEIIFKKGDVVSVDVGIFYKGFHTDTSITKALEPSQEVQRFLKIGERALKKAIKSCKKGNFVSDISQAIENIVVEGGYSPIRALTGHGVGRKLHEDPAIPCYLNKKNDMELKIGMALAIEVMYSMGFPEVIIGRDKWTISMRDGKISALYEETVAVTKHGPLVLTRV